jgi:hypothetical protein
MTIVIFSMTSVTIYSSTRSGKMIEKALKMVVVGNMRSQQFEVRTWLKYHWFWPVAAIFVFDALNAHLLAAMPRLMESLVLFDLVIVIPALYLFCYRRNGRKAIRKAFAFLALGLWVASKLVPMESQYLLKYLWCLWPLRYLEMAVVGCLELGIVITVYRSIFQGNSAEQIAADLQAKTDMPAWLTRLMVLEVMFWKRLASLLNKILRRK